MMKLALIVILSLNLHAINKRAIKDHAANFTNYPSTICAIAGIESTYGKYKIGDKGKAHGMMQIWTPTARFIAKRDKSLAWLLKLPRIVLERILLHNDALSIEIASKLFEYNRKRYGYQEAIIRHNGKWEVDSKGRAVRDCNGNKVRNVKYYYKVMKEMNK